MLREWSPLGKSPRWGTGNRMRLVPSAATLGLEPIQCAEDRLHRSEFDVGVHACAPTSRSVNGSDLNVRDGAGFGSGAQRVLPIVGNTEVRGAGGGESMHERSDGPVA